MTNVPTFGANGTYFSNTGGDGTSMALANPAGIVANSLLIALVHREGNTNAITASGWTSLGTPRAQGAVELSLFWRRATGSETTGATTLNNFSWTSLAFRTAYIARFDGCLSTAPPIEGYVTSGVTGTTTTGIALTPSGANRLAVFQVASDIGPSVFNLPTSSGATWTETFDNGDNNAQSTAPKTAATTTGTVTCTVSPSANLAAALFALIPEADAGGVQPTQNPARMRATIF